MRTGESKTRHYLSKSRWGSTLAIDKLDAVNRAFPRAAPGLSSPFGNRIGADAQHDFHEVLQKRKPVARSKILLDRLWVLECFFRDLLTDPTFYPKGKSLFPTLRSDIRRYCYEANISYDVEEDGTIFRHGPEPLGTMVTETIFNSGDAELDQLLESSRQKFRVKDPQIRRESLEKLWDAWERLKTIEHGKDKKDKIGVLLSKLPVGAEFHKLITDEANELSSVGNKFMIRHSEVNKIPVGNDAEVEYLFYRLFSLIWLILKETGRLTATSHD